MRSAAEEWSDEGIFLAGGWAKSVSADAASESQSIFCNLIHSDLHFFILIVCFHKKNRKKNMV